jgi:hypothetical protein
VDETTGAALASVELDTSYRTGTNCRPLNGRGTGLGYATGLDRFLSIDPLCQAIARIRTDGVVTGHDDALEPLVGQNQGDVKQHPGTGNLWVGSPVLSDSGLMLYEQSTAGQVLREFSVLDADTDEAVSVSRLAFDATGARLWLLAQDGDVYEVADPDLPAVPALGPWAQLVLIAGLALGALGAVAVRDAGRRRR